MEYLPYVLIFGAGAFAYHITQDAVVPLPKDAELTPTNYYRSAVGEADAGHGESLVGYTRIPGYLGLPRYEFHHRDGTKTQSYFPPDLIHDYTL